MRLELGSRAEGKGGGAPTGMSATAAVASKPVHTPKSLRRQRPNAVPMACCTGLPRGAARGDCVRKRQQDEPVPLLNGASASRPRNEASAITSLTGLNARCPIARRRATDGETLHRINQHFSSNNPHGTGHCLTEKRANGVPEASGRESEDAICACGASGANRDWNWSKRRGI